eukprot:TRINITY_DN32823_c0_g1_i2.p2 TRINITY_DN32823_c0_g1~~TRINITY_DN32823_c0_g1_i2.p2  ORF type:complete len:161 (+),score=55.07 TRINITY_DN32823_c0_g1_i2:102-584(+)
MIRRPPRSTQGVSSAASDVYKRQVSTQSTWDSKNWGVEAVSDNIVNFAKNLYERYKLEHEGEDLQEGLESFYNMAKNSIQAGYDEAMNYLGVLPDDVQELSKATLDRSLEKLDTWYQNGGKDVEVTGDDTIEEVENQETCLLYTSPSPRDLSTSRMPSSA